MKRLILALSLAFASVASAQSLPLLPRTTASTGMNDSALTLISDSAQKSRAATMSNLFRRVNGSAVTPSYSFINSTGLGLYRFGADTLGIATGGVQSLLVRAQTSGNSRRVTLTAGSPGAADSAQLSIGLWRAGSGVVALRINESQQLLANGQSNASRPPFAFIGDSTNGFGNLNGAGTTSWYSGGAERIRMTTTQLLSVTNGTAAAPSIGWSSSTGTGLYRFGADTIGFATGGTASLRMLGGANVKLLGGAGDMTIRSGTQAGSALTIQLTNSGGSEISAFKMEPSASGSQLYPFAAGAANAPVFSSAGKSSGMYFPGNSGDTTALSTANTSQLRLVGNKWIGGDASLTVLAGIGNSRTMTLQTTTSAGTAKNTVVLGADTSATFLGSVRAGNGTASLPALSFSALSSTGFYNAGGVMTLSVSGTARTQFNAGSINPFSTGGQSLGTSAERWSTAYVNQYEAGSSTAAAPAYTFTTGTGYGMFWLGGTTLGFSASGRQALALTDSQAQAQKGRVGKPSYSFSAATATGFYSNGDTIMVGTAGANRLKIADLAATGAGDVSLCLTTTGVTNVITQGATCGTSTRKVKTNFMAYTTGLRDVLRLRPTYYAYQSRFYGGRYDAGFIAEDVAAVNRTFALYAGKTETLANGETITKGDPININDRAVIAALVSAVQELSRQVDSLKRKRP